VVKEEGAVMKEPGGPLGMPKVGRDGGGGLGGGSIRSMSGINGRAGSNVQVVYKNGNANPLDGPRSLKDVPYNNNKYKYSGNTQGSKKLQPITSTGDVKEVAPGQSKYQRQSVFAMYDTPKKEMPTQQQLDTVKGNARGMKAANKPIPKRAITGVVRLTEKQMKAIKKK